MLEKKIKLNDAYSLKTPEDSIKLYKKWAKTYDLDFANISGYLSPKKISSFYSSLISIVLKKIKRKINDQIFNNFIFHSFFYS